MPANGERRMGRLYWIAARRAPEDTRWEIYSIRTSASAVHEDVVHAKERKICFGPWLIVHVTQREFESEWGCRP